MALNVVSRDDYAILEYSVGKDNSAPDLKLAKKRFNRRRKIVERYYKKMGYIENHFKMAFWNPCIYTLKTMRGIFRLPFIAISDYRYEHDSKYKERIRRIEEEEDRREAARIKKLKDELNIQIQQDIAAELETKPPQEIMSETLRHIEQESR